MWIKPDRMISLGYGRFVRSDDVSAVEPIQEGRGPRHRALVYLRGRAAPMVASRSEEAIVRDLTGGEDEIERTRVQRQTLQHLATSLDEVSGGFRRRLREREGIDLDRLVDEAHRATA